MIKYLVIDVDGTLTDGVVYIGNQGELCKGFFVKDGLGIKKIMEIGVCPVILTARESEIVVQRCQELGIQQIYQGVKDKKRALQKIIADDLNDYEAMQLAGLKACPADAVTEIVEICDFVSDYNGGRGAVRQLCELILGIYKNEQMIGLNSGIEDKNGEVNC